MKYRIGCSGYYYPQWKNKLYPKGVPPKNWLAYYSSVFNTVELNGTFYRTPKLADLKKYATVTGDDFTFSVKMSRFITHIQRIKEKQPVIEFQDLILQGLERKLEHFLFQLPPSFHFNEENLQRIIDHIPHDPRNVVELRHISWWNEQVKQAFKDTGITFCNVDFPGLESYFMHTSSEFYLRLHGNPKLFVTPYTAEKLEHFCSLMPDKARTRTIYFNNTVTEAGFQNALQLMNIVNKDKASEVVSPPA
jgi:uncharacterized protein YecE (DUF72 family)